MDYIKMIHCIHCIHCNRDVGWVYMILARIKRSLGAGTTCARGEYPRCAFIIPSQSNNFPPVLRMYSVCRAAERIGENIRFLSIQLAARRFGRAVVWDGFCLQLAGELHSYLLAIWYSQLTGGRTPRLCV